MKCSHPHCTGVHDNNRYAELCPRAIQRKRDKDTRYYCSLKGQLNRVRKLNGIHLVAYAELPRWAR